MWSPRKPACRSSGSRGDSSGSPRTLNQTAPRGLTHWKGGSRPDGRDLEQDLWDAPLSLMDNSDATGGSSWSRAARRGSTTRHSSRPRAWGSTIRSGASCSSSASTRRSGRRTRATHRSATAGARADTEPFMRRWSVENPQSDPSSDPSSDPASVTPRVHHRSPRNSANAQVGWPEGPSVYRSDSIGACTSTRPFH